MLTFGNVMSPPCTAATASARVRPANTSRPLMERLCATKWFTDDDCVAIATVFAPWRLRKSVNWERFTQRMLLPSGRAVS